MDNQAIKPTFYQEFSTKVEEIKGEKELDKNQQALAHITHFKGWELLKAYAGRLEDYLDNLVSEGMANGLSMNDLGERTMVKELSKLVIKSFISKAEDARRSEER